MTILKHGSTSSRRRADPAPLREDGSRVEPLSIDAKSALGSITFRNVDRAT
jgi:hypothetical protein